MFRKSDAMTSYRLVDLLSKSNQFKTVIVKGWVKAFRANRFIALNDGSTIENLQCVVDFKKTDEVENELCEDLLSPMPGTFYTAPTPDDEPFVSVGDKIKKGQTLCIIEAMKIMNEIESEFDGTIINIKVDNGDPVEYNQSLFEIQPR